MKEDGTYQFIAYAQNSRKCSILIEVDNTNSSTISGKKLGDYVLYPSPKGTMLCRILSKAASYVNIISNGCPATKTFWRKS